MNLKDIEALDKEVLTCKEVSAVLGMDQMSLHLQAQTDPSRLGFPVIVAGTRVKIPRQAFIKFMRGE